MAVIIYKNNRFGKRDNESHVDSRSGLSQKLFQILNKIQLSKNVKNGIILKIIGIIIT